MSASTEKELLAEYLSTLGEEIAISLGTSEPVGILGIHRKFLSDLAAIRKKMATSSYNFKALQRGIEVSAGQYLTSLDTLSKSHKKHNNQLIAKDLEAIRLGVGKALIKIEKINATAPPSAATNWFVSFCKNLYQSILDLIQKKRLHAASSAKQQATLVEQQQTALEDVNKAIDHLKGPKESKESDEATEAARNQAFIRKNDNLYVKIFNHSPKKAIALLPEDKNNPKDIAKFLTTAHELDQSQLADYLGEKNNGEVLKAYIAEKYTFEKQSFSDSIRRFLETFKLPNEGQKIERVMEAFAERYYEQNKQVFDNKDAAYVLAVAVVMLNTDAFNPKIPANRKMTEAAFIKNLKGANGGKDFPQDMLKHIYQDIKQHEIKKSGDAKPSKFKKA